MNGAGLLFARLFAAHLICDFFLQNDALVAERSARGWRSRWLYAHGAVAGVLAYVFVMRWQAWWVPLVIAVTHIFFDGMKNKCANTVIAFAVDQGAHLLVLCVCWALLCGFGVPDLTAELNKFLLNESVWVTVIGYLLVMKPAGIMVGTLTRRFRAMVADQAADGLDAAGVWIGYLERVLILTFILINRVEAIGFLIAAKSIYRFPHKSRRMAEYMLIGTMISFVLAIGIGLLARRLAG